MKRIFVVLLGLSMLLTGCFGGSNAESDRTKEAKGVISNDRIDQSNDNQEQLGGGTLLELKKKYGSDTKKTIMPLYNVEPDQSFTFHFKADLSGLFTSIGLDEKNQFVSVHTDIKAYDESRMKTLSSVKTAEDGSTIVTVEPIIEALKLESNPAGSDWGSAPIYYLKISYDLETEEPTKLDEPVIIPFTVKSEIEAPTLQYQITEGRLKLVWEPVEGADYYNIYQIKQASDLSNWANTPISGAETGYDGLYPFLQASVEGTEFMDWFDDGSNGLGYFGTEIVFAQNMSVMGDYFITAVKGNNESLASNFVSSAKLGYLLPNEIANDNFKLVDNVDQLPRTTKIKMIDRTEVDYNIIYHTDGIEPDFFGGATVPYSIQGTVLTGQTIVKKITAEQLRELATIHQENTTSARIEPKNETDYVPSPDVPTIIDLTKDNSTAGERPDALTADTIIEAQRDNTKKIVEEADQILVPLAPDQIQVNADSALEEYLALHLLNGVTAISMEGFPEAQNFEVITDTLQKVVYQNPFIIGVNAWGYDYSSLTLFVRYNDTPEDIHAKQEEIIAAASRIINEIIETGMSDEQKREAIYRYLADNTAYDHEALKAAESNNFQGNIDEKFNDSFTTYGIMVNKVGVCMSYAYSYKLLSDLANIESIVVTGVANGVPHAWNKVKINNEWLHVDVTNNDSDNSLGFRLLYNSNDDSAVAINSILTDEYWIDTELSNFYGTDNSQDYYVVNGLEAGSIEEYAAILSRQLADGQTVIVIRFTGPIDQDSLYHAIARSLQEHAPDKLDTAGFTSMGNYIIVITDGE